MNNFKIRWSKTAGSTWVANEQLRNAVTYSAQIVRVVNVYTLTTNPGAIATIHPNLRAAKNQFRKYLLDK